MIGQRVQRRRDGFTGIVLSVSAWSSYYFLVEAATGTRVIATERQLTEEWTLLPLPALLATHAEAFGYRMAAVPHVLRWLCEQLVRALLWGAWEQMMKREGEALDRAFLRFCRLVDAAPCWPCRIDFQHPRLNEQRAAQGWRGPYCAPLCITSGQAAEDAEEMAAYMDENFA